MGVTLGDIAVRAAQETAGILGAVPGPLAGEAAEQIRDYVPGESFPQVGIDIARKVCRVYGSNPDGVSGVAAAGLERVCRPYLDDIGAGEGPKIDLPFRGGQCAQTYILRVQQVEPDGSTPFEPDQIRTRGPIAGIRYEENFNGIPNLVRWSIGSHSNPQVTSLCTELADEGFAYRPQGTFTRPADRVLVGIVPCGSDDCGNPPPEYSDPVPPTEPEPPRSPIVIAPDIDIDVEVQIGPEGVISIDIGTGPITIDPFGGESIPGGGNPPGAPEGGPVLPGGNGGFGGDDELGEPPAGKRWVGVCLAITERPDGFGTIPSTTVDKVYPEVVGNVRLICNAAGTEIVNTPVQIRSDRVCLWEPVRGLNPVAIRVNLKPGFGYAYQGYAQPVDN